ncbi:DUF4365 domain-containing protein [Pseudomonas fluorescens]|uniref:DUF4365 domain-containing protein n=1 Tax=Pseudomonas fluorescens TaxID=294 RepID=UPI003D202977
MPRANRKSGGYTATQIGQEGESFVRSVLNQRVFGIRRFRTTFLGETAALFDFVVEMVDEAGKSHGQFCMLQVKSTERPDKGDGVPVSFSLREVKSARKRKIPTYLVGVQINDVANQGYLLAIDDNRNASYDIMPTKFNIEDPEVLAGLYNEVVDYHDNVLAGEFFSAFTEN